jgi:hypothetical protein
MTPYGLPLRTTRSGTEASTDRGQFGIGARRYGAEPGGCGLAADELDPAEGGTGVPALLRSRRWGGGFCRGGWYACSLTSLSPTRAEPWASR